MALSNLVDAESSYPKACICALWACHVSKWFPSLFSDFLLYKESLPLKPSSVDAISGAYVLVKREALEDVGLWDRDTSYIAKT